MCEQLEKMKHESQSIRKAQWFKFCIQHTIQGPHKDSMAQRPKTVINGQYRTMSNKRAVPYKHDMAQRPIVITHNQHMINGQSRTKMTWLNSLNSVTSHDQHMINGKSDTKMTWLNGLNQYM